MGNKTKKNEGPACACGRGNLYWESLKLKENEKEEVSNSTVTNQAGDDNSSAVNAGNEDQMR